MTDPKYRYCELDYMNGIASVLVVWIHVLSPAISQADPTSLPSLLAYFPYRLSAFVVPLFLYTGAVKFAARWGERAMSPREYLTYVLRRITKIYLPYVLWVVIYYAYFLSINFVQRGELLRYILDGTLSSPFYYIVLVMQFYLLAPLWNWLLRRAPAYLSIGVSLLITMFSKQISGVTAFFGVDFPYADRIASAYLVFWVIGLYVGQNYGEVSQKLCKRSAIVTSGICALACAGIGYIEYYHRATLLYAEDMKIMGDVMSILFLQGILIYAGHMPKLLHKILSFLYESSFFVYLSHCLVLSVVAIRLQERGVTDLMELTFVRLAASYTIPYLGYAVWRAVKRGALRIVKRN